MEAIEAKSGKQQEIWDRLVLLLISRPLEGWEAEFSAITRREIERLSPVGQDRDFNG